VETFVFAKSGAGIYTRKRVRAEKKRQQVKTEVKKNFFLPDMMIERIIDKLVIKIFLHFLVMRDLFVSVLRSPSLVVDGVGSRGGCRV
jgi:hypothetical protein